MKFHRCALKIFEKKKREEKSVTLQSNVDNYFEVKKGTRYLESQAVDLFVLPYFALSANLTWQLTVLG